jgi:hypothetical protein
MRRIYIDQNTLIKVLAGQEKLTQPVGYAYDEHNRGMVLFVATDKETGAITRTPKKGHISLNVKPQRAKEQGAGLPTIGEVLAPDAQVAAKAALGEDLAAGFDDADVPY